MTRVAMPEADVPAPGQLVTVRNRRWVAADVVRGEVASGDPHVFTGRLPHLVSLVSIEDDARDEELRVVWELEPGRVVHDTAALPDPVNGFDEPAQLDAFLDQGRIDENEGNHDLLAIGVAAIGAALGAMLLAR